MKTINYLLTITAFFIAISCINHNNNKQIQNTNLKFTDTLYDLGTCKEGDTVIFHVEYKNIGKHLLELNFAQGSCNCTEPILNQTALKTNAIDSIKVYYYSSGQSGLYRGTVIIGANTIPSLNQIFFNVNVLPKK